MSDLSPTGTASAPDLSRLASEVMSRAMAPKGTPSAPSAWEVLRRRLPFMRLFDRLLCRSVMLVARRQIGNVSGIEHIVAPQPFILALNHSTRREAVIVPAALIFHRGGRLIHFWSDWVYRLIPGIGLILRRAGTIVVITKPGKPRILNLFKPFFMPKLPAIEQARAHLKAGRPIGVFPEGTTNRDPRHLLPGRFGTARLSLETGVPIVPAGIYFPGVTGAPGTITEDARMEVRIGAPLVPPASAGPRPTLAEVRAWHAVVMTEIAHLSGKRWEPLRAGEDVEEPLPAANAA